MAKKEQEFECEICGATSDKQESCCGQPMKKVAHAGSQGHKGRQEEEE